jgi:hypothetical protein
MYQAQFEWLILILINFVVNLLFSVSSADVRKNPHSPLDLLRTNG